MVETVAGVDTKKQIAKESWPLAKPGNRESDRQLIADIFSTVIPEYQATRRERGRMHKLEWDSNIEYSILGDIELFDTDVAGYASQIADYGYLKNFELATGDSNLNLWRLHIFGTKHFDNWFFSPANDFPKLKAYVQKLDYLRLLVIDYVETYLLPTTPPAAGVQPLAAATVTP